MNIRSLLMACALLTVVACSPAPSVTQDARPAPIPSAGQTAPASTDAVPADDLEFYVRMEKFAKAYDVQDINAYPYPPDFETRFLGKYPFFKRLDCTFEADQQYVYCTFEAQRQEISQEDLSTWLPYLSNRDVLNPVLRCTQVCLNAEGVLVGAVQPAMLAWMETHCAHDANELHCERMQPSDIRDLMKRF